MSTGVAERAIRRVDAVLGGLGLLVLCLAYCLPGHPSARVAWVDVAAHVGLFAAVAWGGWLALHRAWVFAVMAVLGLVLEVVQWWIGGYPRVEWMDVLANVGGVSLAALLSPRHRRSS